MKCFENAARARSFTRIEKLLGLGIMGGLLSVSALAQSRANVSVDLAKPVNMLIDTSLSVPAFSYDASQYNQAVIPYLRAAGITAVRFPANHGVADLYHWSTKTTTRYKAAETPYVAPDSNFGSFAQYAEKLGRAVIVVNYGSNQDGDGGGEPAEAAAWVAYANGDPNSTVALGKDSTGEDWKTVGYWATLRSQAPLAADDGLNFLRIQHPRPFNFKLWQIGDQIYKNGFFGGEMTGNPDLHDAIPTAAKDWGKLKGNAKMAPAAVAANLVAFSKAMKAVDPTILLGLSVPVPGDESSRAPEWASNVLKGACSSLDYANLEWTTSNVLPPDWKILDEPKTLGGTTDTLATILNGMIGIYNKSCPKDHMLRLAFAPAGIATWPKIEHPMVNPLWIADTYAMLIESGSININAPEMIGDTMISADRKKLGPSFYGLQMLHIIARAPGDLLLNASSNFPSTLSAHATHRRDGMVGIMLINKDPQSSYTVKVTLKNGTVGTTGKRFDYGAEQLSAGAAMTTTPFSFTGNEFTVTVAPYSIADILLPDHN